MNDKTTQTIVGLLENYSSQGLTFEQAKEELAKEGYSDEQINLACDNYSYGTKASPDVPANVENYFEKHPDQAAADAANISKAVKEEVIKDERTQAELDIAAGVFAPRVDQYDIQAQVKYEHDFASDVGISYGVFLILVFIANIVAAVLVKQLDLSHLFYVVNGAVFIGLIVLLIHRIR